MTTKELLEHHELQHAYNCIDCLRIKELEADLNDMALCIAENKFFVRKVKELAAELKTANACIAEYEDDLHVDIEKVILAHNITKDENERLTKRLDRYEGHIGSHWDGCHTDGYHHYDCLLRKFNELEAENAQLRADAASTRMDTLNDGIRAINKLGCFHSIVDSFMATAELHKLKDKP